jgi:hypothetical protein
MDERSILYTFISVGIISLLFGVYMKHYLKSKINVYYGTYIILFSYLITRFIYYQYELNIFVRYIEIKDKYKYWAIFTNALFIKEAEIFYNLLIYICISTVIINNEKNSWIVIIMWLSSIFINQLVSYILFSSIYKDYDIYIIPYQVGVITYTITSSTYVLLKIIIFTMLNVKEFKYNKYIMLLIILIILSLINITILTFNGYGINPLNVNLGYLTGVIFTFLEMC